MENIYHKVSNLMLARDKPVSIIHFLTNRCNARCPHCFIDFDNTTTQQAAMSLRDIDRLTQSMGPQLMNVNFTGGEPFLVADIAAISELYFRNTSIDSIFISTHGGLTERIKEYTEKFAARYTHKQFIFSISVDHISEQHNKYRKVQRLFEKAMETYHYLAQQGTHIMANITITVSQFNAADIDHIFNTMVHQYGVRSITANVVRNEGVYKTPEQEKQQIWQGYCRLVELIEQALQQGVLQGMNNQTRLGRMMNYKDRVMYKHLQQVYREPQYKLPCYAGGGLMGIIYPNGDVYPCEILEDKKMGNLYDYDMNLSKLWEDNEDLRQWILASKCHCSYECAWSYNLLASPSHWPAFAWQAVRGG